MMKKLSPNEVHDQVRRRYGEIAYSIKDRFKYPAGREGLLKLGYDLTAAQVIHEGIVESFCGVGNPFSLGPVRPEDTVLDVGCGGGFDVVMASHFTGPEGRVYGIDLVPAMVEKAKRNIMSMELSNCEIRVAGSEAIPFDDNTFDVVISNGAIYLSPLKEKSLNEVCRVLKPGGCFQFADVVLNDDIPEKVAACFDGWAG
ncbi:MAG: methyltransferase domain-containing protein [Nitrospiraceae bacterium]|nr:MAG: methyltransferase domain-containing protein [Nitrospiraceae bacterium]